jgi:hypothetical protein
VQSRAGFEAGFLSCLSCLSRLNFSRENSVHRRHRRQPGRNAVKILLPKLRAQHGLDVIIANGENSAGGNGITPDIAAELFSATAWTPSPPATICGIKRKSWSCCKTKSVFSVR